MIHGSLRILDLSLKKFKRFMRPDCGLSRSLKRFQVSLKTFVGSLR